MTRVEKKVKSKGGFTILEVVIAMAIIAIVTATAASIMTSAQKSMARSQKSVLAANDIANITECFKYTVCKSGSIDDFKKVVVDAAVQLFQLDDNAGADVQLPGFVFGICSPPDIAAAALKLGAKLFLRQPALPAQSSQIIAHISVTPDLLFHYLTTEQHFSTGIACN